MDMNLSKLWEIVEERETRPAAVSGVAKSQTQVRTEQQQLFEYMHKQKCKFIRQFQGHQCRDSSRCHKCGSGTHK